MGIGLRMGWETGAYPLVNARVGLDLRDNAPRHLRLAGLARGCELVRASREGDEPGRGDLIQRVRLGHWIPQNTLSTGIAWGGHSHGVVCQMGLAEVEERGNHDFFSGWSAVRFGTGDVEDVLRSFGVVVSQFCRVDWRVGG